MDCNQVKIIKEEKTEKHGSLPFEFQTAVTAETFQFVVFFGTFSLKTFLLLFGIVVCSLMV